MAVHTSSKHKLKQATNYVVTDTRALSSSGAISRVQDPYHTRLDNPLDTLWLDARSNVFFVYNRRENACAKPFAATHRRLSFLAHAPGEQCPED